MFSRWSSCPLRWLPGQKRTQPLSGLEGDRATQTVRTSGGSENATYVESCYQSSSYHILGWEKERKGGKEEGGGGEESRPGATQ